MDYLIAPTLFKNKTCRLPGIGTISVITNTAETDFVNTQIKAPVPTIVFSVSQDDENVFNEFTALSELIKKDLDEKGSVTLRGIGDFIKDEEGVISFIPQQINHAILVGDKETTNTVMTEYFEEEEEKKDRWWIWAIVLGAIGTGVLVYYLLQHDGTNLGNAVSM
jgi:hypothetical protein